MEYTHSNVARGSKGGGMVDPSKDTHKVKVNLIQFLFMEKGSKVIEYSYRLPN